MADRLRRIAGVLYVVATPIGNLEDITLRAIKTLRDVDAIACEDTRHTARLLFAHGIHKPLVSYFEHNEKQRTPELIDRLRQGESIALVSDAGTPAISDPGYRLVRGALDAGYRVVAIPGPSAVIAALSIAGLPTDRFCFEGFIPARPSARRKKLAELKSEPRTMVFFESPRRLAETLADMADAFGADRPAAMLREISKVFEETIQGTLGELAAAGPQPKGEVTLVVGGAPVDGKKAKPAEITIEALREAGLGLKQASDVIARLTNRSRREVYQEALQQSSHDASSSRREPC